MRNSDRQEQHQLARSVPVRIRDFDTQLMTVLSEILSYEKEDAILFPVNVENLRQSQLITGLSQSNGDLQLLARHVRFHVVEAIHAMFNVTSDVLLHLSAIDNLFEKGVIDPFDGLTVDFATMARKRLNLEVSNVLEQRKKETDRIERENADFFEEILNQTENETTTQSSAPAETPIVLKQVTTCLKSMSIEPTLDGDRLTFAYPFDSDPERIRSPEYSSWIDGQSLYFSALIPTKINVDQLWNFIKQYDQVFAGHLIVPEKDHVHLLGQHTLEGGVDFGNICAAIRLFANTEATLVESLEWFCITSTLTDQMPVLEQTPIQTRVHPRRNNRRRHFNHWFKRHSKAIGSTLLIFGVSSFSLNFNQSLVQTYPKNNKILATQQQNKTTIPKVLTALNGVKNSKYIFRINSIPSKCGQPIARGFDVDLSRLKPKLASEALYSSYRLLVVSYCPNIEFQYALISGVAQIRTNGFQPIIKPASNGYLQVVVGPFKNEQLALKAQTKLIAIGFKEVALYTPPITAMFNSLFSITNPT